MKITAMTVHDVRFPTSRSLDGSDAMNPEPDYSAAYVVLETDDDRAERPRADLHDRPRHRGVRRRDRRARAARGRAHARGITGDLRGFWRSLVSDDQLRWLGPEKGVIHLATAAIVNAVWDLWAKRAGLPLWKLLADLPPEESSPRRLSLHRRRADAGRGARPAARRNRRQGASASCSSSPTATPPTRPRRAGSDIGRDARRGSPARRSTKASATSS